jgi:hypothetical protein
MKSVAATYKMTVMYFLVNINNQSTLYKVNGVVAPLGELTPMLVPGKQEGNKNLPLILTLLIRIFFPLRNLILLKPNLGSKI